MGQFVFPPVITDKTGLATEIKQDDGIVILTTIDTAIDLIEAKVSTEAKQDAEIALLTTIDTDTGSIEAKVATEAKQDTQITSLSNMETDLDELNARLGSGLVPEIFDFQLLTYVAAGNGTGEIETVVYRTGGSGGTIQATLTLAYDASDRLSTVTKT